MNRVLEAMSEMMWAYPLGVAAVLLMSVVVARYPPGRRARVVCCWIGAVICMIFWLVIPLIFWRRFVVCCVSY